MHVFEQGWINQFPPPSPRDVVLDIHRLNASNLAKISHVGSVLHLFLRHRSVLQYFSFSCNRYVSRDFIYCVFCMYCNRTIVIFSLGNYLIFIGLPPERICRNNAISSNNSKNILFSRDFYSSQPRNLLR